MTAPAGVTGPDVATTLADAALRLVSAPDTPAVLGIAAEAASALLGGADASASRGPGDGVAPGALVAPLRARDGAPLGALRVEPRPGAPFTDEDEAVLAQLARLVASGLERHTLYEREREARTAAEEAGRRLLREKQRAEALQRVGAAITARLELGEIVQVATDAARELTPAAFGAFFYNVTAPAGGQYMLYTLSGVPRSAFERFPMPRATKIFGPTFEGEGTVRYDDVLAQPQYGQNAPFNGMPQGHLPVRSYLAVPVITSDGGVAGGLFFGHPDAGVFDEDDARLVEGIAAQSAIAIENARLYDERTQTARALQQALLPPDLPAIPGVELSPRYRPAGAGNEVGGDFYDGFRLPDGSWAVVVGDVCGKGPRVATVTALARYTLRAHASAEIDPALLLERLNGTLLGDHDVGFVTAVVARLRPVGRQVEVELASAGHPLPIVARAAGGWTTAGVVGTPLGVLETPELPSASVTLDPGDVLLLYTDGISEAAAPRRLLDDATLAGVVGEHAADGAPAVADAVEDLAVRMADGSPRDDLALLAVRVPTGAAGREVVRRVQAGAAAADAVRDAVAQVARDAPREAADRLRLVATELVANAIRHGGRGMLELRVSVGERGDRVSVLDDGPGFDAPERPVPAPTGPGGLGLHLVDALAADWGVDRAGRTRVWAKLERDA